MNTHVNHLAPGASWEPIDDDTSISSSFHQQPLHPTASDQDCHVISKLFCRPYHWCHVFPIILLFLVIAQSFESHAVRRFGCPRQALPEARMKETLPQLLPLFLIQLPIIPQPMGGPSFCSPSQSLCRSPCAPSMEHEAICTSCLLSPLLWLFWIMKLRSSRSPTWLTEEGKITLPPSEWRNEKDPNANQTTRCCREIASWVARLWPIFAAASLTTSMSSLHGAQLPLHRFVSRSAHTRSCFDLCLADVEFPPSRMSAWAERSNNYTISCILYSIEHADTSDHSTSFLPRVVEGTIERSCSIEHPPSPQNRDN